MTRGDSGVAALVTLGLGCLLYALWRLQPLAMIGVAFLCLAAVARIYAGARSRIRALEGRAHAAEEFLKSRPELDEVLELDEFMHAEEGS